LRPAWGRGAGIERRRRAPATSGFAPETAALDGFLAHCQLQLSLASAD